MAPTVAAIAASHTPEGQIKSSGGSEGQKGQPHGKCLRAEVTNSAVSWQTSLNHFIKMHKQMLAVNCSELLDG